MKTYTCILFITAATLLSGCNREAASDQQASESASPTTVKLSREQFDAAGIKLGAIESRELSGSISLTGMLDVPPQNAVTITAPFGGFLRSTPMLQGMKVKKGQPLAVIENPEYVQLQQDFIDTRGQAEFLQVEYDRQLALSKENVNAQKTLQRALADLNSMKARNNGLRARLKMLQIDPDQLSPEAIRSTIDLHSPINGYITQINAHVGGFINATDVIFRIVDTEHLHAELTAFEKDVPFIRIGQKIHITMGQSGEERTGTVYLVGKEVNADRTVRIHGHLDKMDPRLIPGMYLKAVIETGGKKVSALPEAAVVNFEDRNYIFIQNDADPLAFDLFEVTPGIRENGFVEVILPDGTPAPKAVVVQGAYKLLSRLRNAEVE